MSARHCAGLLHGPASRGWVRTAFPAVADRASGRAVPVHRARYRRQGHLLVLGAVAGTAAEFPGARTAPDRDRLTILEMRIASMRTTTRAAPKPGHTRSGEHGRTSSPESGTSSSSCCNQTGCSPHRGWIHCGTRSIMDPYAMGSRRRRPVSGSLCRTAGDAGRPATSVACSGSAPTR